jgi:hypothetical protein
MTSMSDPQAVPQVADAADAPSERMPRGVRLGLMTALAMLMTGALYLVAVRGEALLVDLAALGSRLWCF